MTCTTSRRLILNTIARRSAGPGTERLAAEPDPRRCRYVADQLPRADRADRTPQSALWARSGSACRAGGTDAPGCAKTGARLGGECARVAGHPEPDEQPSC